MISAVFGAAFVVLCVQAAVKDTMTMTIPNWMNVTLALMFVPAAIAAGISWPVAGYHLLVGLTAFVLSFGLFAFGLFGGGDAKMIPGVLLWIGPGGVLEFIVGMTLGGGALAVIVVLMRKAVPVELAPPFARKVLSSESGIPYGVAIATGALFALPASPLLTEFLSQFSEFG